MKVMLRDETALYIQNEINNNRRIVAPRYGDGEYLLMTNQRNVAREVHSVVGPLLRRAVKKKGQLICTIPGFSNKDTIWTKTARYIQKTGGHTLYGTGAWARWDLDNNNEILYRFFKGKVLLISSNSKEAKNIFNHFETYSMPGNRASSKYKEALNDISIIAKEFDNIIFACGPIGKVIISDIIDVTNANLIDIGHTLNALLKVGKTSSWGRHVINNGKIDKILANILEKLK